MAVDNSEDLELIYLDLLVYGLAIWQEWPYKDGFIIERIEPSFLYD